MDEYLLEINDLRRRIAKLKFERASITIIEELEAQLRILKAIHDSATELFAAGEISEGDRRLFFPVHRLQALQAFERSRANTRSRDHFFHTFNDLFLGLLVLGDLTGLEQALQHSLSDLLVTRRNRFRPIVVFHVEFFP